MNYGATLQAFALQRMVASFGHEAVVINYEGATHQDLFVSWATAKGLILNIMTLLRYRSFLSRRQRVADFRKRFLPFSSNSYASVSDLEKCVNHYGAFICGSDQVWRPNPNYEHCRVFYLDFAKQAAVKKIAYAPSFGVASIPSSFQNMIKPWIEDIPYLSVREETGKDIIAKTTERDAQVVLDPTLLMKKEQWDELVPGAFIEVETPYILVYSTSQRGLFSELIKHIKVKTQLPIVVLSLSSLNLIPLADRIIYDAGPCEFIKLFANASCVCTNSFHGIAFSVIYRKPFWSVPHDTANSRISDLLSRIDLSNRQVDAADQFPEEPLDIDFTVPSVLIEQERMRSIAFLEMALQN
ncbi:MAG: polysaccharide pyruvyl transferase family protein [Desulfobacterales bacterium]